MSVVRAAVASDVDACVEIAGGASDKAKFARAISDAETLFLVAEWGGAPVGFLMGTSAGAIEDFAVEVPALWPSVGQHLLREARARLKERGATRIVVREGDDALLESEGFSRTPNGWTAPV